MKKKPENRCSDPGKCFTVVPEKGKGYGRMKYINEMAQMQSEWPTAVTLGKFDGFHRGHQMLLSRILQERPADCLAVVFTFDVPPVSYMNHEPVKTLLSWPEKCDLVRDLGADWLVACPFTEEIRSMTARRFVEEVLVNRLRVREIVTGADFRFGYQRSGDVALLQELSTIYGYRLQVVDKARDDGQVISSTLIRAELAGGNMERVNRLLGYPFHVTGEVVHGARLGRTIGMPTINQIPGAGKLLPPNGVYVTTVDLEGNRYPGVTNIGYKPTVSGKRVCGVETYLLDVNGDFYGKTAKVMLHAFVRPEQKFHSVEELTAQMNRDAARAAAYLEQHPALLER